jgi:hypothetical protein
VTRIHRQAAHQGCGDQRISGKALRHFGGEIRQSNRAGGQRIEADRCLWRLADQNETRSNPSTGILAGLRLEIAIERFDFAGERIPIVAVTKRLDAPNRHRRIGQPRMISK